MRKISIHQITIFVVTLCLSNVFAMEIYRDKAWKLTFEGATDQEKYKAILSISSLEDLIKKDIVPLETPANPDEFPVYIEKLINEKQFHLLQNFLDAIVFPMIHLDIAEKAYLSLFKYVISQNELEARYLFNHIQEYDTVTMILKSLWDFKDHKNIASENHNYRFEAGIFDLLQGSLTKASNYFDPKEKASLSKTILSLDEHITIIPFQIRLYKKLKTLRLESSCIKHLPKWLLHTSLQKIFVNNSIEIPDDFKETHIKIIKVERKE